MIPKRRDYPIYRPSVVRGEVTSDDVPSPPSCLDLEDEYVGSIVPDGLHREYWRWPVEECHPAAVSARSVCSYDAVSGRLKSVDPVSTLRLLENAQVDVGLGHSMER